MSKGQKGRALLFAVAAFTVAACSDNRLPPNPLPPQDPPKPPPAWYPEKPWTARDGETQVYIKGKIVFDVDKATIRPESAEVLKKLKGFLDEHDDVTLMRIEGHTDSNASDEYNLELSAKRSLAVCDWLVDQGVDHTRLLAVGYGETKPIAPNDIAKGREENRRTEFHVAEIKGRAFGKRDPERMKGGYSLLVKSKEEREKERVANLPQPPPPPPPPFKPKGDVIEPVTTAEPRLTLPSGALPDESK